METALNILANCWWIALITGAIAYLLGSINTAVMVTSIVTKGKDIRKMGSGNAGFTNVLRSVGKVPAIITIVCDALKCVVAVLLGGFIFSQLAVPMFDPSNAILSSELVVVGKYVAGVCCILGHSYPLYFGFKGGKGVVSAAGLMLSEDWRVFLLILGTFLIIFIITKVISIASISCAALYAPYTFLVTFFFDMSKGYTLSYVIFSTVSALLIGIFVIVKHKENIKRIIRGEEKKITAKKKSSTPTRNS